MSVYIFLTTFFYQIPHFSPSFVIFLSYGHAYRAFSLRLCVSLSLSFLLSLFYPETRARFTPKSGYFRSEKRAKKARIRYTKHEEGRFWSAVANEAMSSERTNEASARAERTEGCRRRGRRERESRVKQRRSRRENENHASAYEERG